MDVHVYTALNDSEHDQLDAWIRTRRDDDIDYVTIETRSVAIHERSAAGCDVGNRGPLREPRRGAR